MRRDFQQSRKSHNKLLADDDEILLVHDETVAKAGAEIVHARKNYCLEFTPDVVRFFEEIARPCPDIKISYSSTIDEIIELDSIEKTTENFIELLYNRRQKDRWRKSTTRGPHLDDLKIQFDGVSAKTRASQGQHRALVLAIKLAEIVHLERSLEEPPVLLLDDISSELDIVPSNFSRN